jgi:hypothetical protein
MDAIAEAHVLAVQRGICWVRMTGRYRPVALNGGDLGLIHAY